MNTKTLLTRLGRLYPKRIALKNGDYVGYMAGKKVKNIRKIVLVLDLDEIIIDEVLAHSPDLVITHHPLIYGTRYKVFKRDAAKEAFVRKLDELPMMVYSIHTNFDEAPNGMNDALIKRLGVTNVAPLEGNPMARGAKLIRPLPIKKFAKHAVTALNAQYGELVHAGKDMIETVAIIGGGGSRSWRYAFEEGYDIYISGDAPHHVRRDVMNAKYNYLNVPHEIENIFMPQMKEVLLAIDPTLEVIAIKHEFPPELVN